MDTIEAVKRAVEALEAARPDWHKQLAYGTLRVPGQTTMLDKLLEDYKEED